MVVTVHKCMAYEKGMGVVRMRSRPSSASTRMFRLENKEP